MMDIKDRIKKLGKYFQGMQIVTTDDGSQVIYVVVKFPYNWIIDDELEKKFGVTVAQGNSAEEYYFCTDIDSGEQILFDAIDYNIDKMKEAIERAQLLSKKTTELKALFENETVTIEELRTLKFTYDKIQDEITPITLTKSQKKENEKNKEEKNQEIDE